MKNAAARQLGEELKAVVERLKALAQAEHAQRGPDSQALDIAVVHLDTAMEILTE